MLQNQLIHRQKKAAEKKAKEEAEKKKAEEEYKAQVKDWVDYYYGYMTEAEIIQNMGEVFLKESAFTEKLDRIKVKYGLVE